MAFTLSNPHLQFTLDPSTSSWSLFTQTSETPSIEGARFNGLFRFPDLNWPHLAGLQPWHWRGGLDGADVFQRQAESVHGPLEMIVARAVSGLETLAITIEFALPKERPFLLIRLRVQNLGDKAFRVARLNPLFAGPLHRLGNVRLSTNSAPPTFFSNGWQSWSFAGTLITKQIQPYTNLGPIQAPVSHNPLTPKSDFRRQFSSDMFGVLADPTRHSAIVAGFTSQREQFGSIDVVADALSPSLRLRAQCDDVTLPPGGSLITDNTYVQLLTEYDLDPLRDYAEAVARENNARVPAQTPTGWCSWYHYFDKVTEADLRANLEQVDANRARLPLTLVQLDDGFEANVGDWFETNSKFPSGLRAVADSIRARNLIPGLWLAPFIAKPDSKLAREHPDWFLRNTLGLPGNAGFVFDKFCRGLDVTHPAVQDHTRKLIGTAVNEWGYPYLKLDFLYAAALPGKRHDPTRTRAQALRLGLELIREAAGPETFLLGCGCPLGSAIGLVDGMRISADVDARWRPAYKGVSPVFRDEPAMPSARNAIRNTLTRAALHRRWWLNDPDCLLVRDTTQLTLDEVKALASVIALSGGMFLVSDDLTGLSPERRKLIEPLLPVLGKTALARDWLEKEMPERLELPLQGAVGEWTVSGLFNWGDRPVDRTLAASGHIHDFWSQAYHRDHVSFTLPPHSGRLLAVRPVLQATQFVGSSFHFSQGGEVAEWAAAERHLRFVIDLGRRAEGEVTLSLPANPQQVNGNAIVIAPLIPGIYRIPVSVDGRAAFYIEW
ncbi:MAG: alpha-galactosidase [Chloroflexi bacterium]|nr:alpha-galactosidase [Chloroflexota bacterium]